MTHQMELAMPKKQTSRKTQQRRARSLVVDVAVPRLQATPGMDLPTRRTRKPSDT